MARKKKTEDVKCADCGDWIAYGDPRCEDETLCSECCDKLIAEEAEMLAEAAQPEKPACPVCKGTGEQPGISPDAAESCRACGGDGTEHPDDEPIPQDLSIEEEKVTRIVEADLSDADLAELGRQLAEHNRRMLNLQAEAKEIAADFRRRIETQMEAAKDLVERIENGKEGKSLDCILVKDYSTQEIYVLRGDTREEVEGSRRKMYAHEMQAKLGLEARPIGEPKEELEDALSVENEFEPEPVEQ